MKMLYFRMKKARAEELLGAYKKLEGDLQRCGYIFNRNDLIPKFFNEVQNILYRQNRKVTDDGKRPRTGASQ